MNEGNNKRKIVSISLMLFAMFFGAGNMIFPPMLGYLGGTNFLSGALGFTLTDAGLSIIGIAAVVLVGGKINNLGELIGPKFGIFFGLAIYFLIGPLFALPRTGTVSYSMAIIPFLGDNASMVSSLIFSAIFFGITYFVCLRPNKLVDIVGNAMTPILLISIAVIFFMALFNPVGEIGAPTGDYADIPLFKGIVEGYLALDGFAALAFAIVVINAVKDMGIKEPKNIAKYTIFSGIFAGIALGLVYMALAFVGAQTSKSFEPFADGAALLSQVVNIMLGKGGNLILGVAVMFACLTTSIGLASSFSEFFNSVFPKCSYKAVLTVVCLFSFAVSNIGLSTMLAITLPALIMVYPPVIVLTLMAFGKKFFGDTPYPYACGMICALGVGIFDGLKAAGLLSASLIEKLTATIPFFGLGLGWIVPTIIGIVVGMVIKAVVSKRA